MTGGLFGRGGLLGRGEKALRGALLKTLERWTALPASDAKPAALRRILLLRIDRVGDMIVSTPAIHAIRRRFPEAEVHVVASRANAQILKGNPDVDAVHVHSAPALCSLFRVLRSRWDVVADLNTGPSLTSGLLARLSRTPLRVSFDKERAASFYDVRLPPDEGAHRARETMKVAEWLGADGSDLRYRVHPSAEDEQEALSALEAAGWRPGAKCVAVHPGNIKKSDNRWPEDKFAALCERIKARGDTEVILLQGFDEEPLTKAVRAGCRSPLAALPPLGLLATACVLKRMQLVICNSTATLHLASAVGVKSLSFVGGYTSRCWGALEPGHRELVSAEWNSCRDIPVERAWSAVQEML